MRLEHTVHRTYYKPWIDGHMWHVLIGKTSRSLVHEHGPIPMIQIPYALCHPHLPRFPRSSSFGRPTMEGKTVLGASSPPKPALHMPLPLSKTSAATSSAMLPMGTNGNLGPTMSQKCFNGAQSSTSACILKSTWGPCIPQAELSRFTDGFTPSKEIVQCGRSVHT